MTTATQTDRRTERQAQRQAFREKLEKAVADAVADQVEIGEEDTRQTVEHFGGAFEEGGVYCYVEDCKMTVVVDGDALLGWYVDDSGFFGRADGCRWYASVHGAVRRGRELKLTLHVESD